MKDNEKTSGGLPYICEHIRLIVSYGTQAQVEWSHTFHILDADNKCH